jgi:hypothetical protein
VDTGTTIILPGTTSPIPVIDASQVGVPFLFDRAL